MTNQLTQINYTGRLNRFLHIAGACTIFSLFCSIAVFSQRTTIVDTSSGTHAVVIAGKQYKSGTIHNLFWGSHYRNEWSTPVKVKVLKLDSAFGGLMPIAKGGGGIMLAPFNKITITGTYAMSAEGGRLNARIGRLL